MFSGTFTLCVTQRREENAKKKDPSEKEWKRRGFISQVSGFLANKGKDPCYNESFF